MAVDLSAFYSDISKDRLYTFAAGSPERRSAQTTMFIMADGLARLLAPILPVTSEQLWSALPGSREESVHLSLFPTVSELDALVDGSLVKRWERLNEIRDQVVAQIEPLRKDKQIGSSLQAKVVIAGDAGDMALLRSRLQDLPMLFIVSEVELGAPAPDSPLTIGIEKAQGTKCERCWRYVRDVSAEAGICGRCQDALAETVSQ